MKGVLLDTNVIIGAVGLESNVSVTCQRNCYSQVKQWRAAAWYLILDTDQHILSEYIDRFMKHVYKPKFQGTAAEYLFRDLRTVQGAGEQFRAYPTAFVPLIRTPDGEYEAYPKDPELSDFDRSDRKFVAAALSYQTMYPEGTSPEIVNATDSDWEPVSDFLLERYQVIVNTICG
jgi:hypothetical protein